MIIPKDIWSVKNKAFIVRIMLGAHFEGREHCNHIKEYNGAGKKVYCSP